jgi:hypothetical protein
MEIDGDENRDGGVFFRFPLDTASSARQSFARLIRAFAKDKIDRTKYHELVYGLSSYFSAIKVARDDELENRILALEEMAEDAPRFRA